MTANTPRTGPDGNDARAAGTSGPLSGRRAFLAAAFAGATGLSGCLSEARELAPGDAPDRVALTVKTTPADDDPYAIRIAQRLAGHLDAAGVGVDVVPMRNDQLLKDMLVGGAFELYVAAHPGGTDPDFLFPLLHSRFSDEPGWQNPFGFADDEVDDLLERQRRLTGETRRATAWELQRVVARATPFSVVGFPVAIRAVRTDRYDGWGSGERTPPLQYLALDREAGATTGVATTTPSPGRSADERGATLSVALTDGRPTENLNPLAVHFRNRLPVTGLLYDPLLRREFGEYVPWLATSVEWAPTGEGVGSRATVELRDDAVWHDGTPVTATDVAFTYRFLADTSLGSADEPVPAPRFRGRQSLVAAVEPIGERRLRLSFEPAGRDVAARALTVPVLPEHVWRPRSGPADLAGIEWPPGTTEALVWPNMDPVGSGPLAFRRAVKDETLLLDRFEEHFVWGPEAAAPGGLQMEPAYDRLAFRIVPSDGAAVELLAAGEVDATDSTVHARAVPDAIRSDGVELVDRLDVAFYHVGFNARHETLSNPRFRRAVARLIDEENVATAVFGGFADPAASPLARSDWLAPGLEWDGWDPVTPFVGTGGTLDEERARRLFEGAGHRYDGDGRLLRR